MIITAESVTVTHIATTIMVSILVTSWQTLNFSLKIF
ncbi:hypothetical protein RO3G_16816 [Rhizopus delemar RA 99-880]|uniref:Uncharacterized protein n=1 Tax=Rhizopus delemar (strain RA 99-880 / ATCC MYA-4621 / FGSC 9543 / NRRL 43880) TaxID=246409 RepID=I1CU69_RHIO9|nr:hypothetical protein RO3G_14796 [Rhizopus delemar RA 99-880]EIE91999.1 hypothetical protein RO3G_16710 [Rhizopus delemar RA 99-880]EIE92105.1 hypothetical protein RO3G_16816 [Rhizopus delemar RA 99-880]|eukprot:EIE90085.1 hypothetical protein RO3G_14796 [Rhizopus delemar RA 99-880]